MGRKFIKPALQAVYLQFRDKDKWFTVMDFNPSEKERLHFYDDRVREYINLDLLNLEISYRDKNINVRGKHAHGLLVKGSVSGRLRLAIQSDNEWFYTHFNVVENEEGEPVLKLGFSADNPDRLKVNK